MTVTLPTAGSQTTSTVATRRVLHVINGEHYSGAERVQDLLAQNLPACGFDVSFACVKPDRFPEARQYQKAPLYLTPMQGRFDLDCGRAVGKLVRSEQFALVHAHTPRSLLVATVAARQAGVPLVYHVHSPTGRDSTRRWQNLINAWMERRLLKRAVKLIAVSPSLAELMISHGIPAERIVYVPNGVPTVAPFARTRPSVTWTIGMAALFRPRKGVEVLLHALAELRSQGHDLRLRAIGPFETPEYEREVMKLTAQLDLDEALTWTGFVHDIHAELRNVDLFVLPSLFGEGLPMVVLEALAAGLPVIASNVEGLPVAIRHGVDGLLVEAGNSGQLAAAIQEIISRDSSYDYLAMCGNASTQHARNFSAEAMAAGVARVYREVLRVES